MITVNIYKQTLRSKTADTFYKKKITLEIAWKDRGESQKGYFLRNDRVPRNKR